MTRTDFRFGSGALSDDIKNRAVAILRTGEPEPIYVCCWSLDKASRTHGTLQAVSPEYSAT